MELEIITRREGERIAARMRVNDRRVTFVRGDIDRSMRSMRLIVEARSFGLRRRYEVDVQGERFYGGGFVEVLGIYYPGHLIFGSMNAEDAAYELLEHDMQQETITQTSYWRLRLRLDERIGLFKKEMYKDKHMYKRQMLFVDMLAAASAGLAGKLSSRRNIAPLAYAGLAFVAAHLIQRLKAKGEVIEKWRIRPDDSEFGKYVSTQPPMPVKTGY